MIGLLLDTTVKGALLGAVAVDGDGTWRLAAMRSVEDNVAATARLPALAEEVLAEAGAASATAAFLAVGEGPGSFTGIKIGLAFAQGFALGAGEGFRLLPVSALACLAAGSVREGGAAAGDLFALPATRTEGYGAYVGADGSVTLLAMSAAPEGLLARGEHEPRLGPVGARWPVRRIVAVQPWPALAAWATEAGLTWAEGEFSKLAKTTIMGMADAAVTAWREGRTGPCAPRYFRLSAPEEKLLTTKEVT